MATTRDGGGRGGAARDDHVRVAGGYPRQGAGDRGDRMLGIACFGLIVVACSSDIRAIRWRTVTWGLCLQVVLAMFILRFEVAGVRPGYALFSGLAAVVTQFLAFTNVGSEFVFGVLANQEEMGRLFPNGLVLAFAALPIIIFVSSVFAVLYHLGVLQLVVRMMARLIMPVMGTSGAETLAVAANVFMGQTEAPIIVRPYIPRMTQSELLTLMTGGLATIAGSVLGVYISLGADPSRHPDHERDGSAVRVVSVEDPATGDRHP